MRLSAFHSSPLDRTTGTPISHEWSEASAISAPVTPRSGSLRIRQKFSHPLPARPSTGSREGLPETITLVIGNGEPVEVEVERWERPRGGAQSFWRCPKCEARREHLYVVEGLLACRVCHRLDYRSRHVLKSYPAVARAAKLRRKLGAAPGLMSPLPPRPKHNMQAARYDRLARALATEEDVIAKVLGATVAALKRRKGRLHGPR